MVLHNGAFLGNSALEREERFVPRNWELMSSDGKTLQSRCLHLLGTINRPSISGIYTLPLYPRKCWRLSDLVQVDGVSNRID